MLRPQDHAMSTRRLGRAIMSRSGEDWVGDNGDGQRLQEALDRLVRDFGPEVTTEPERLRSGLSDLLAERAITLRPEIDAVVLVATLQAEVGPAPADLLGALTVRGTPPGRAETAVQLWSTSRARPTTDPLVGATELPDWLTPATALPDGLRPGAPSGPLLTPATALPDDGPPPPPPPPPAPPPLVDAPRARARRRPALLVGAAAAALALIAGVAWANRGDDKVVEQTVASSSSSTGGGVVVGRAGSSTTSSSSTTSTTTTATTTPPPSAPTTQAPTSPGRTATTGVTPTTAAPTTAAPTTAAPTTAAPTTAAPTTAPPPPAPVAVDDSYSYTVQSDGQSWYTATLRVLDNDGGTYDYVQADTSPAHGSLSYSNGTFQYTPHHNGYFTDSFVYHLVDSATGRTSSATVYLTVYCNQAYQCS